VKRQLQWFGAALLVVSLLFGWADAQRPTGGTGGKTKGPKLPEDPRLLELHMQFVKKAEKLGAQYQQDKQLDKAIACYKEILRLVPTYGPAQAAMAKIFNKQVTAQKAVVDCMATKGWQDTGVDIVAGKPLVIAAKGTWKLRMEYPVTGDGIEIPRELRRFNLGSLIGIIIGEGQTLNPKLEAPPEPKEEAKPSADGQAPPAEGQPPAAAEPPRDPAQEQQQQRDPDDDDDDDRPPMATPQQPQQGADSGGDHHHHSPFDSHAGSDDDDGKPRPFYIGKLAELVPSKSGRLYLRMYDADPDDNIGKMTVQINGTFGKPGAPAKGK
jgi:hypothetical protein